MEIIIGKILAVILQWIIFIICSDMLLTLKRSKTIIFCAGVLMCVTTLLLNTLSENMIFEAVTNWILMFVYILIVSESNVKNKFILSFMFVMISICIEALIQESIDLLKLEMPRNEDICADLTNMLEILKYILVFYYMEVYCLIKNIFNKTKCNERIKENNTYYCKD